MRRFYTSLEVLFSFCLFIIILNTTSSAAQYYTMNEINLNKDVKQVIDKLVNQFNLNTSKSFRVGATDEYKTFDEFKNSALTGDFNAFYFAYFFNGNGNSYYSYMVNGIDSSNYVVSSYSTSYFEVRANSVRISNLSDNTTGYWDKLTQSRTNVGASSNNNNYDYYVLLYDHQGKWFEYSSSDFNIVDSFEPKYKDSNHTIVLIDNVSYYNPSFSRSVSRWYTGNVINVSYFNKLNVYYQTYNGTSWVDSGTLNFVDVSDGHAEVYFYEATTLYNQAYRLFFIYDNHISDYFYYYFSPHGQQANSGDIPVYIGNDNNNGINNNQMQQENQDFWRNTYNSLFVLDSGDVNEIYTLASSYFDSGDTPLSVYDTIFGSYMNEPDDFIIRWEDIPLNITWLGGTTLYSGDFIQAGSINFSKECRDNETLGLIKFWVNTFNVIGFYLALTWGYYTCILKMLGVFQPEPDVEHKEIIGFRM